MSETVQTMVPLPWHYRVDVIWTPLVRHFALIALPRD